MKKLTTIKIPLLAQIVLAIALGIAAGFCIPVWAGRIFATFNTVFSQFLGFIIPLIIIGLVAPAIADIGKGAGKMLLATVAIAYGASLFSGFLGFFTGESVFPMLIPQQGMPDLGEATQNLTPYFNIEIPPLMNVMTSLVFAFMAGIGMIYLKGNVLKQGAAEFREIISSSIRTVIIPLLPLYIFGIFLNMTVSGQVGHIISAFLKIIVVIFILHIFILLFEFTVAGITARQNPLRMLWKMLPAYFTALGTQSSAATIPVTLRQTVSLGVNEDIAGFTVPLCATIHMSGSIMKIVTCALALMMIRGLPYDTTMFAGFICMLGITIVAAPGVPGGSIMASLGLLSSMLGFSETDQALMIALYIAMDSFGTACNVTGDGFIAVIIDRIFASGRQLKP